MKYSEFIMQKTGRTIIFGGDQAERDAFAKCFLSENSEFKAHILPVLENTKKPLFGRHKSACEVMVKELKKDRRRFVFDLLIRESKHLELDSLTSRSPRALSGGQRLRWSILYYVITGERSFLLRDDTVLMSSESADMFEKWAVGFTGCVINVVRITDKTGEALDAMLSDDDECYEIKDGELVKYTKPTTVKSTRRTASVDSKIPAMSLYPKEEPTQESKPEPVEQKSENSDTVEKILRMKEKYNGIFSNKQ